MAHEIRRWRHLLVTATTAAALIAAAVSAAPAGAQDGPLGPDPDTGTDTSPGPDDADIGGLLGDDGAGPVGHTGAPTFSVVRGPDSDVPTSISVVVESGGNAEVHSFAADDGESAFITLIKISNADAPTEYRFDNAIPADVTVYTGDDGSYLFLDADGNQAGYISPAWAFDANGTAVPTSYRIDGTTLIQTVDHSGATYPVIADPSWWETQPRPPGQPLRRSVQRVWSPHARPPW